MEIKVIVYGRPPGNDTYIPEFYCSVCNSIPIGRRIRIEGAKNYMDQKGVPKTTIEHLFPVPTLILINGKATEANMAVCAGCLGRIKKSMSVQILKRFGKPPEDQRPPEEPGAISA